MNGISDYEVRASSAQIYQLWSTYRGEGDRRARDELVTALIPLVKHIAYRKARVIPGHCDVEDLVSCGFEALLGAIDRFDPSKGATLEQYAWTRVHGAVLDELRRTDWAPRSVRRWERELAEVRDRFTSVYGRSPSDTELSQAAGIPLYEVRRLLGEIARSQVASLNETVVEDDGGFSVEAIDTVPSHDRSCDPEYAVMRQAEAADFRSAFSRLPTRERQLAVLVHVNEMSLHEAGQLLGISPSRASHINRQIKTALQENGLDRSELTVS
jgi:RNA polymerase sigma factor for flagellar operon FliA